MYIGSCCIILEEYDDPACSYVGQQSDELLQRGRVRREALGLRRAAVSVGSIVPLKSTSLAEFQCFSCWTVPL